METFHSSLEEIRDRFTWSEIVLMGWRSQEQVYKMKLRMDKGKEEDDDERSDYEDEDETAKIEVEKKKLVVKKKPKKKRKKQYDGHVPEGLPDRFYDENGEVNLSKVELKDALKYLNGMGFRFPVKRASRGLE
jgi:hypothetical protein